MSVLSSAVGCFDSGDGGFPYWSSWGWWWTFGGIGFGFGDGHEYALGDCDSVAGDYAESSCCSGLLSWRSF